MSDDKEPNHGSRRALWSSPPRFSSLPPRRGPALRPSWPGFSDAGTTGAVAFTVGIAIGDVVWLTLAIVGLAALAQAFHDVFLVVKWAGAAYLLYHRLQALDGSAEAQDVEAVSAARSHPGSFSAGSR